MRKWLPETMYISYMHIAIVLVNPQKAVRSRLLLSKLQWIRRGSAAYELKNGNDIYLSWESVTNADNYKVYQIVDGQKVLKSTVSPATAVLANVPAGDYTYEVHANSARFGESAEWALRFHCRSFFRLCKHRRI